jgi:hypothetical protein
MKACSVVGCSNVHRAKGLCSTHYNRIKNAECDRRTCSVSDCGKKCEPYRNICESHRKRSVPRNQVGELNPYWFGDNVSYRGLHKRLDRRMGKAYEHSCDCGDQAAEWSYLGGCQNEIVDPKGRPYSTDLALYAPMCVACHRSFDENRRARCAA